MSSLCKLKHIQNEDNYCKCAFKVSTFVYTSLCKFNTNKVRILPIPPPLYPLLIECYPVDYVTKRGLGFCPLFVKMSSLWMWETQIWLALYGETNSLRYIFLQVLPSPNWVSGVTLFEKEIWLKLDRGLLILHTGQVRKNRGGRFFKVNDRFLIAQIRL